MSKIKDGNYIVIQSFMVNELNLKGNELIVYAVIFGFSQTENQVFNGGLQYLAEWTNSTKQSVINCLKSLQEKGFIEKNETYINNIKFVEYYATKFNGVLNKVEPGVLNKVDRGIKQSLTNNINNNINLNNKEYIKAVIQRLNEKAGTKYRESTESTVRHIKARFNDGFSLDDFFTVIDKKVAEWKGTDMEKYLRPETLFGSKFESYLNARVINNQRRGVNGIALDDREFDILDDIL